MITVVQTLSDPITATTDTQTKTLGANVTPGNALIDLTAYLDGSNNSQRPTLPTSILGVFSSDVSAVTQSHDSSNMFSTWNSVGGSKSVTNNKNGVTTSGQANWTTQLIELSGVGPTDQGYGANSANGASFGPVTVTSSLSVNVGDIVIAMFEANAVETGLAIPSGWLPIGSTGLAASDFPSAGFAYKIVVSPGFQTANFGTSGLLLNWSMVIKAFPANIVSAVPLGSLPITEMHWRSA